MDKMEKIKEIKIPKEPKYETGQTITRIPLLIETVEKVNELIKVANRIIDRENHTLIDIML